MAPVGSGNDARGVRLERNPKTDGDVVGEGIGLPREKMEVVAVVLTAVTEEKVGDDRDGEAP